MEQFQLYGRTMLFLSEETFSSRMGQKAASAARWLIGRYHRGRGQQQTTVKHVTVNADQAVVTDQIVSREAKEGGTAALLTIGKPIEILEPTHGRSCHRLGVQFQWGRGQLYSRSAPFYHCRPVIQSRNFSRVV